MNHRALFEVLITFVHTKSRGAIKAARAVELISLPLTEEEETWLMTYLAEGKGNRMPAAADTLKMRAIATGRSDHMQYRRTKSSEKIDGVNWETLSAISS